MQRQGDETQGDESWLVAHRQGRAAVAKVLRAQDPCRLCLPLPLSEIYKINTEIKKGNLLTFLYDPLYVCDIGYLSSLSFYLF